MRRHELEHIIRASAELTQEPDIVVVGSQAILARRLVEGAIVKAQARTR